MAGTIGDVKFNSQTYLNSYMDEIIPMISASYDTIFTLDTSNKSLSETLALLNGVSENSAISNLQTYQYNSLIPKVRLYRVNYDNSEYQFIFNKDYKYTTTSILQNEFIVGNNCGIKSINWILAGTNPVSAEKTIEVKIEFYFDSIAAFSGGSYDTMLNFWNSQNPNLLNSDFDNPNTKTTTNFWSLIYHPKMAPNEYKTSLFRIKAVVGWEQIDPIIINELFKNKSNINESLFDSDLVMYLNLVQHNFAFNEDGSIKLTANYIASIENSFSSKNYDLLRGLKESIEQIQNFSLSTLSSLNSVAATTGNNQSLITNVSGSNLANSNITEFDREVERSLKNLVQGPILPSEDGLEQQTIITMAAEKLSKSQIENKIKFLSYLKNNPNSLKSLISELKNCEDSTEAVTKTTGLYNTIVQFEDLNLSTMTNFDSVSNVLNEKLISIENELETLTTNLKLSYYSRLLKILVTKKVNNKYRLYSTSLDYSVVSDWLKWNNNFGDSTNKPSFNKSFAVLNDYSVGQIIKNDIESFALKREAGDTAELNEGIPSNFDEWSDLNNKKEESKDSKTINFTTVGHIIDAAFEIIKNDVLSNPLELIEFNKNKLILSTFANNYSFASIPIAINNLIKFMNEILYERGATQLSLFDFIKELMIKVVEPALEVRTKASTSVTNKYSNVSISSTIVHLGSNSATHPLRNFSDVNRKISLTSKKQSDLKSYYLSNSNLKNGIIAYNYFIFYDRFNKDFKGKGNKLQDEQNGIYHFTVGQDYGLVKSINFKKIDQPFLKESKSVGKKTIYLGQFRDLYNADIKMVGNNLFHPGMIIFIKPNVEFGNVISSNVEKPTFAQITGVGGYYTVIKVTSEITDDSYTTTLDCVFHSNDGLQPEEVEKNCNYTELQKAGLISSDGVVSPIPSYVISALQQFKKGEEIKEEFEKGRTRMLEPGKI